MEKARRNCEPISGALENSYMGITVLMYHAVSKAKESNKYTLEEKDFQSHIEFLCTNNYKCILVDEYYQYLLNPSLKIPEKSVVITFDDGHESNYTIAFPLFKKYNFKATFFITTDWIGKHGYMTSKQLKKLKEEGMSVQSHAKTHFFLDEMSIDNIYEELEQSKKVLENILGEKVTFFSFPGGRYNSNVIKFAKEIGYLAFFSSSPFSIKRFGNVFLIGRYGMKYSFGEINYEKLFQLNPVEKLAIKTAYYVKRLFKKVIGNNIYYYLWKRYFAEVK
jgi:peptidoglycan/xylan/chitin deacetylase (PgdA/CDA1 family)